MVFCFCDKIYVFFVMWVLYFCFPPRLCSEREYVSVCLGLWNKGLSRQTRDFLSLSLFGTDIDPAHTHLKSRTGGWCSVAD